jgi:hypothetical protein
VYLHNLTTILADEGTLAKPGSLNYSLLQQPPTVHEMLMQKGDSTFALVVWNERVSGADDVTVEFSVAVSSVNVFDPTIGTLPVQTHGAVDSLTLTLSDHPLIVEMIAPR